MFNSLLRASTMPEGALFIFKAGKPFLLLEYDFDGDINIIDSVEEITEVAEEIGVDLEGPWVSQDMRTACKGWNYLFIDA
jgi:hypothetical protein